MNQNTVFSKQVGIKYPIICGAMYPCSNPELVAAASEAGGIGIIQPLSMVFAHKHDFRKGMQFIKSLTKKPVGLNIITEKSSKLYEDRMKLWLDIALEEGVRFFVTSLGNPKWVVDKANAVGGIVYHDVTERKWAEKALESGVHGVICVNNRAGGHAGELSLESLYKDLESLNIPIICAGGVSDKKTYDEALSLGYAGVQMGTRFIATKECNAHQDYKNAILKATSQDIVLTEKISGVPVSVIKTEYIEKIGTKANPITKYLLKHKKMKHWMRLYYTLQAVWKLKRASLEGSGYKDYWQAGKSVDGCNSILTTKEVIDGMVS
ncbi:NAD(P)H-dependent flavin oxidoreductase [Fluviispira multicolorata]|uniref:Nitronate monooxygenase n=1 Tax=Fluviispira multicolorata TaxID=2654512 RepID=A0A833N5C3_9BACT|nr:nitronate monooxygenase [Fluviispira multicolorata]KAB8030607.1 nitronate monooxygenase [Fluviispira multicolorata]